MKKKNQPISAYLTYALADNVRRDPKTNAAIPSDELVREAKQWVEQNQK